MPIPLLPALALATAMPPLVAGMRDALQRPTRIRLLFLEAPFVSVPAFPAHRFHTAREPCVILCIA